MFRTLALSVLALAWLPGGPARAEARLPIFDTHVHYSQPAWGVFDPPAVAGLLQAAGVARALVSSTPDDGSLRLEAHDSRRFTPELRPYRTQADMADWFRSKEVLAHLEDRLSRRAYAGIGEFHLFDAAAAGTPEMRRIAALAVARDIPLHIHADAAPVRALFAIEPRLKILWAHAGFSEPAAAVGEMLDTYERLWAEVSFRAAAIAPGGRLDPAWRAVLTRHANRFMIGSDTYVTERWHGYGAIIDEHRAWLAQLPPDVAEAIAYRNAVRLFGDGGVAALKE